jgi:hypothetical protein
MPIRHDPSIWVCVSFNTCCLWQSGAIGESNAFEIINPVGEILEASVGMWDIETPTCSKYLWLNIGSAKIQEKQHRSLSCSLNFKRLATSDLSTVALTENGARDSAPTLFKWDSIVACGHKHHTLAAWLWRHHVNVLLVTIPTQASGARAARSAPKRHPAIAVWMG